MRTLSFLTVLIGIFLLIAAPASADYRDNWGGGRGDRGDSGEYIEDKFDQWIEYAEDLGYDIIEAGIYDIRSSESLWFDLGPGEYHVYAEGGRNIEDLDMIVYDNWGYELASDFMADNFPIGEFTLYEWQDVEFELSVFEQGTYGGYGRNYQDGRFCFVLAMERNWRDNNRGRDNWRDDNRGRGNWRDDNRGRDRGRDHDRGRRDGYEDDYWHDWDEWSNDWNDWWTDWDRDGGRGRDRYDGRSNRSGNRGIVEDKLDYLFDFARDRGMDPIMDDIGEINNQQTYSLMLHEGYYVVFAAGGPDIEDLDLHVSWRDGWEVAEDIGTDAAPAVWFYVPSRTTIDIEVEVWSFEGNNFEDYYCILVCED